MSGAELVQAALEHTGVSIATSADTARAIALRGLVAMLSTSVTFVSNGGAPGGDSFEGPWEELPHGVQSYWLTLAGVINKVTREPGWSGSLGGVP